MSFEKYQRILILTGEVSGDMHGAHLLQNILELNPKAKVFAVGSDNLKAAGATIIKDIVKKSTIGFLETIKNIPTLLLLKRNLIKILKEQHIDLLICIDFQGFNMIIAKKAKELGIPVAYYIPPQEWVWGSEKGMKKITEITDKIVTIFKQEHEAYKKFTNNVRFFGHPLTQIISEAKTTIANSKQEYIAVFPGSRKQEIKYSFPEMIKVMEELIKKKEYKFIVNLPNTHYKTKIETMLKHLKKYTQITVGETYPTLAKSKFALVTSGTITLECLLMNIPHAIFYKFNPISFLIVRNYLQNKFKFDNYSLTNILAGKEIVPEYLQNFDTTEIANNLHQLMENPSVLIKLKEEFMIISKQLSAKEDKKMLAEAAKYILG